MSNAKQEVEKLIQKKRDKIRNARRRIVRQQDVYNIVLDFIKDMENALNRSKTFFDFDGNLNEAARKLDAGICRLDPLAQAQIVWSNNLDISEKWHELQVDSVVITWSDTFSEKTGRSKEETIDIGHLFLEGYFV